MHCEHMSAREEGTFSSQWNQPFSSLSGLCHPVSACSLSSGHLNHFQSLSTLCAALCQAPGMVIRASGPRPTSPLNPHPLARAPEGTRRSINVCLPFDEGCGECPAPGQAAQGSGGGSAGFGSWVSGLQVCSRCPLRCLFRDSGDGQAWRVPRAEQQRRVRSEPQGWPERGLETAG